MFRIALCLPGAAQTRAIQALCTAYFAGRSEPLTLCSAAADDDAVLSASDLIFFSAAGRRPNGMDTAARLRASGCTAALIFLASGPEYAMEAFELSALQYFIPPVSRTRMFETLDRVLQCRRGPALAVSTPEGLVRVNFASIAYVECTDHILHFHLTDGRAVRSTTLRIPLRQALQPLLAEKRFYQPHRSYVINLDAVHALTDSEFCMTDGARVPVPRGRTAEARAAYLAALTPSPKPLFSEVPR